MITRFDDYPIHQTAEPIAHTATSDRYTYDRFWYNGHDKDGAVYFGIALARYPNLGIMDCAFSVVHDGRQYAFFGSRRASGEPTDTTVGPFRIEILEPMGRHRLVIDANETGIECDLIFTPYTCAVQEGRQTRYNERHLIMDVTRLDQFGWWEGVIMIDGQRIAVDGRTTLGLKDRSWGIRPVGERHKGGAPLQVAAGSHFMWLPIHWGDHCSLLGLYENEQGHQWHTDQVFLPVYPSLDSLPGVVDPAQTIWQGRVHHELEFRPGTRWARCAKMKMSHYSGESLKIEVEPVLTFFMKGLGYQHPEWGHGNWKGELAIDRESWVYEELDPMAHENLHIQQIVVARCGDRVGHGVLEQVHLGPYAPYGFKGASDGFEKP